MRCSAGRRTPKNDERYAARALHDAVVQASWQVETIETTVRDRLAELAAFPGPKGFTLGFPSAAEAACDRLTDAANALHDALNQPAAKPFQRLARKMLIDELAEGGAAQMTRNRRAGVEDRWTTAAGDAVSQSRQGKALARTLCRRPRP